MQAYEIFRDELRRQPSRVLYSTPDFILYEEDEIYVSITDEESLRIQVIRHQPPVALTWRKRIVHIARSFSLMQFVNPPVGRLFVFLRGPKPLVAKR